MAHDQASGSGGDDTQGTKLPNIGSPGRCATRIALLRTLGELGESVATPVTPSTRTECTPGCDIYLPNAEQSTLLRRNETPPFPRRPFECTERRQSRTCLGPSTVLREAGSTEGLEAASIVCPWLLATYPLPT